MFTNHIPVKLFEITSVLEKLAPLSLQEHYDNAGLLLGDAGQDITMALLCLDVTEQVVDEAISIGCNLIISHHPVIFSGLKRLTGNNYTERILLKAIRHNIALYAAHTNIDNILNGVNFRIAARLGLQHVNVLLPKGELLMKLYTFVPESHVNEVRDALFAAGAGSIGNYDECSFGTIGTGTFRGNTATNPFVGTIGKRHYEKEVRLEVIFPGWLQEKVIEALLQHHPYEEVAYDLVSLKNLSSLVGAGLTGMLETPLEPAAFLKQLKDNMNVQVVRHTRLIPKKISKVAVCGGAGSFLLDQAIKAGADIFISADFKYHQFFDADDRIMIADIGHFESEQFTPEIFAEVLREKFPTFAVHFTTVDTNPINYF